MFTHKIIVDQSIVILTFFFAKMTAKIINICTLIGDHYVNTATLFLIS